MMAIDERERGVGGNLYWINGRGKTKSKKGHVKKCPFLRKVNLPTQKKNTREGLSQSSLVKNIFRNAACFF